MEFLYRQPVTIYGVSHCLDQLERFLEGLPGKGTLICTPHFQKDGTAETLLSSYPKLHSVYADISANPDVKEVQACADQLKEKKSSFVIALGGGSAMDLAKAAATLACTKEQMEKYFGTGMVMPKDHLPLILIPTTAGTGSEVSNVAVLTNRETGKKAPVVSDGFYPDIAIIDPNLTYSVPPKVTACSGMDVLCHAIEAYWSKKHQPICDAFAIAAAKLVFTNLLTCYHHPGDEEARAHMCEASLMAGLAFAQPKTTAPHACSYPLTNIYGIAHGEACALTLEWFARCNADERLDSFANAMGFEDVEAMCMEISHMKQEMKLRMDLRDLDISEDQCIDLVFQSHHPNLENNPVKINDEMLSNLYHSLIS